MAEENEQTKQKSCIKIFAEKEDPVVLSGLFCPIPLFLL